MVAVVVFALYRLQLGLLPPRRLTDGGCALDKYEIVDITLALETRADTSLAARLLAVALTPFVSVVKETREGVEYLPLVFAGGMSHTALTFGDADAS